MESVVTMSLWKVAEKYNIAKTMCQLSSIGNRSPSVHSMLLNRSSRYQKNVFSSTISKRAQISGFHWYIVTLKCLQMQSFKHICRRVSNQSESCGYSGS